MRQQVFITGSTGYIGSRLAPLLVARGHEVTALVREASRARAPAGCRVVVGDALDAASYADAVAPGAVLVHLVGVAHPSPRKVDQFISIDLASAAAAVSAAATSSVGHFVYVSVAQPAPLMRAYVEARAAAEARIRASAIDATFIRPWYVLGPGHRWPLVLLPAYRVLEVFASTREQARRLGLVNLADMLATLVHAVEHPRRGIRVIEVPEIRRIGATP